MKTARNLGLLSIFTLVLAFSVLLAGCGGGGGGGGGEENPEKTLKSIEVTPGTASIALGTNQDFIATAIYSDNSNEDITKTVSWSSSDTGIVAASAVAGEEGRCMSKAVGSVTIAATDSGTGIKGSATLTVTPAKLVSIALTPTNPSIAKGTKQAFVATGTFTDLTTQNISSTVAWSSSDTSVATVSGSTVTGAGVGVATIKATDPSSGINDSTGITVTPAVLISIAVTPANPSIAKGTSQCFSATGTYTDATIQNLTGVATWTSYSTGIAQKISGTPNCFKGMNVGSATIRATEPSSGVYGTTTLSVTPAELVSIAITPPNPSVPLGLTKQFTATGTYTDSTTQNLTSTVTWSSSSAVVADISNAAGSKGIATTRAIGTTTITAIDSGTGKQDSTVLDVTPAVLASIGITPSNPSIPKGLAQQFTATGTYTDSTTQNLTGAVT